MKIFFVANAGTGEDDESTVRFWWLMPTAAHPFCAGGDNLALSVEWTIAWLRCVGKEYGAFIGAGFLDHEHTRSHVWKLKWVLEIRGCALRGRLSTKKQSLLRSRYPKVVIGVMVCFENSTNVQPKNCHVRQTQHSAFPLPRSSLPAASRKNVRKSFCKMLENLAWGVTAAWKQGREDVFIEQCVFALKIP